eukprot:PLAT3353.5.p1 GENE.PLAT3353.5~~PLAT3353.5.p1  ORF type:complete len:579 (-),score=194.45 PLAT3353.5:308-1990(-)
MGESERYAAGIICGFGLGVPHPAHKLLPGQLRPAAAGQRLLAVKLRGAVEGKVMLAPDTPAAMLLALIDLITTHSRCLAFHLESGRPLPMDGLLGACVIKSKRSLYIHVLTRPSRGDMPLLAAIKAADWEAAAALLRELPSAATEEVDAMGRLPLHAALHSKQAAPLTLLDALLHAAPKTVMLRDRTFSLPLHYALASPHTDAAFTLRLLKGFVHGTKRRDTLNRWPLHVALVKGYAASDVVLRLLHAHPTIATVKLRAGRLPLHLACLQRYDAAVIAGLLETSRDAALVADSSGALPLHYAAAAAASADVIRLLLDSADASAATADGAGRLPLHAAASAVSNAAMSEEALALLAVHHTSSAQARVTADCAGLFPIHIAIKAAAAAVSHALPHQLPLLLQQLLLPCDEDGNAAGCDWRGRQGETLLHFACQHGAPPAAIAQLLSALPHLPPPTLQTDAYGRTALHVALQQGAPLATCDAAPSLAATALRCACWQCCSSCQCAAVDRQRTASRRDAGCARPFAIGSACCASPLVQLPRTSRACASVAAGAFASCSSGCACS